MASALSKPLQGTLNEPNVLTVLAGSLGHADYRSATDEENRRGIDGWVNDSGGASVAVQVVKAPAESEYGAQSRRATGRSRCRRRGGGWIKSAIDHRTTGIAPADRLSLLLALAVRHAGLLICDDEISAFARQTPDAGHLGFLSV